MIIDTEDTPKDKLTDKLYNKYISTSDFIGDVVYKDRVITKEEILGKIFPKKEKEQKGSKKKGYTINIFDLITSFFKKDKKKISREEKKRNIGMSVLGVVIFVSILFIFYILNIIVTMILEIMEWWVLAILVLIFVVPIAFAIAILIASSDD